MVHTSTTEDGRPKSVHTKGAQAQSDPAKRSIVDSKEMRPAFEGRVLKGNLDRHKVMPNGNEGASEGVCRRRPPR